MPTILILDDNALLGELVAGALATAGYGTRRASGSRDAIDSARVQRPDVILLEPTVEGGAGGTRFLQALRGDRALARVPVVVLTACADRAYLVQVARLGVRHLLLKSRTTVKELLERVGQCVGGDAAAAVGGAPGSPPGPKSSAEPAGPVVPAVLPQRRRLLTREQCLERAHKTLQAKTLSGAVTQVIAMATSPRTDLTDLADAITRDMVLSARVLQAANAAAYVSNRGVSTNIPEAVRRIGCAAIRNIAASVGVFEAMPPVGKDGFNPIRSWQHSFAVARLCEQLSTQQMPDQAGTAYLAGLCHDLGDILLRTHFGAEYTQVLDVHRTATVPLRDLELEMLGITHDELSLAILRALALPQAILEPIEAMHAGEEIRQPLGRVLRLADGYVNGMLLASCGASPIAPFTRTDCRRATGEDVPATPDRDAFPAEIQMLTMVLSRMTSAEAKRLIGPLHELRQVKLWLARESGLSAFDPLAAALSALAVGLKVSDRLPEPSEATGLQGLVIAARSPAATGFEHTQIARAAASEGTNTLPTLWLAGPTPHTNEDAQKPAGSIHPRSWPLSIDELAEFVGSCAG